MVKSILMTCGRLLRLQIKPNLRDYLLIGFNISQWLPMLESPQSACLSMFSPPQRYWTFCNISYFVINLLLLPNLGPSVISLSAHMTIDCISLAFIQSVKLKCPKWLMYPTESFVRNLFHLFGLCLKNLTKSFVINLEFFCWKRASASVPTILTEKVHKKILSVGGERR